MVSDTIIPPRPAGIPQNAMFEWTHINGSCVQCTCRIYEELRGRASALRIIPVYAFSKAKYDRDDALIEMQMDLYRDVQERLKSVGSKPTS